MDINFKNIGSWSARVLMGELAKEIEKLANKGAFSKESLKTIREVIDLAETLVDNENSQKGGKE